MPQLSPAVLKNLKSVLPNLSFFSTDQALRSVLVDERVSLWKDGLPSAAALAERVDLAVEYFLSKHNSNNENGLILLLEVFTDNMPDDGDLRALKRIQRNLEKDLHPPAAGQPLVPPFPPIEFVNREAEFSKIRDETGLAQKSWVIDAPGGYGKTTFLGRLHRAYEKDGWLCVYVELKQGKDLSIHEIAQAIADCIDHPNLDHSDGIQSLAAQIANGLLLCPVKHKRGKQPLRNCMRSGIALFIDNLELLDNSMFLELADLITCINEGLDSAGFYSGSHHKLRVFLAGCDIRRRSQSSFNSRNFLFDGISLSPYTFHYIQETVQKYALLCNTTLPNDKIGQISARLMYLTGGHPGLTAHVLQELRTSNFTNTNVWLAHTPEQEYKRRGRYLRDYVLADFGSDLGHLLPILNTLSIFRRFAPWLLRELKERNIVDWQTEESAHFFATRLTNEYLLRRDQGILQDSITQRLLSIKLRFEEETRFKELCKIGIELYKNRLSYTKTTHPQYWAVEHVYLSLFDAYYTENLRGEQLRTLIEKTIQEDQHTLTEIWEDGLTQDFADLLMDDWELEFFVNFFLSDQRYQPDHYQMIIQNCFRFPHSFRQPPAIPSI